MEVENGSLQYEFPFGIPVVRCRGCPPWSWKICIVYLLCVMVGEKQVPILFPLDIVRWDWYIKYLPTFSYQKSAIHVVVNIQSSMDPMVSWVIFIWWVRLGVQHKFHQSPNQAPSLKPTVRTWFFCPSQKIAFISQPPLLKAELAVRFRDPRHPVILSKNDWGVQSPPQHSS